MTQMKKKGNPLEQRKKQPKKQFPLDLIEIFARCKDNLEAGSPSSENLKKYFEDVEQKFIQKSNITKTNIKNAVQFKVKSEHPEYKVYFDLENPKYLDHQLKTYFPKLELTQNPLQDILQRTLNPNPGTELEKASSNSNKQYADIKLSIDKAKQRVLEIIPKTIDEENKKDERKEKQQKHVTIKK